MDSYFPVAIMAALAGVLAIHLQTSNVKLEIRTAELESRISELEIKHTRLDSREEQLKQDYSKLYIQITPLTNSIPNRQERTVDAINYAEKLNRVQGTQ